MEQEHHEHSNDLAHLNLAPDRSGEARVAWRTLALWSILVGIASTASLIIIVSIKNIDTLSTVALALAVLAFVAQLLVSLAQSHAQAQQLSASERINTETRGLLSEIQTSASALLSNQSDFVNKVFDQAMRIPQAVEDAANEASDPSDTFDPDRFRDAVEENLSRLRAEIELLKSPTRAPTTSAETQRQLRARRILEELTGPPGEAARQVAQPIINDLGALEINYLVDLGQRLLERAQRGSVGSTLIAKPSAEVTRLASIGLLNLRQASENRFIVDMTPMGREVFRVLTSQGTVS